MVGELTLGAKQQRTYVEAIDRLLLDLVVVCLLIAASVMALI